MVLRTWKIKLQNTHLLKPIFRKWFNDYKYAYNKALWMDKETTSFYSDLDLRNLIISKEVNPHIPWFLETPKDIRAEAVFEYAKNKRAAFTNLANKNINHFSMNWLTKRKTQTRYCFGLPGSAIQVVNNNLKRIKIYSKYTNNFIVHLSKPIPKTCINIKDNCLLKEHKIYFNGENFYLLLVLDKSTKNIENRQKLAAVDPGVRNIVTTWNTRESLHFGTRKSKQIKDLLLKRDKYQSMKNKRQFNKIEIRIKNLTSELHHKISNKLCKTYENIILPELDVRSLIRKGPYPEYRKALLRMRIGAFNELLKTKATEFNCNVITKDVTEAYSSRLCSRCKFINKKCSKKVKNCKNCKLRIDRDINGAKNIYFMNKHLL